MKTLVQGLTLAAAVAVASSPIMAYEGGDMIVRGGVTTVAPDTDDNTNLGLGLDVESDTQLGLTFTYMMNTNVGVEVLAATPFKHEVKSSTLGGATVAETKQLPPTVNAIYYFNSKSAFKPYVGAGVNYTKFFSTKGVGALDGTDVELKDSWGLSAQIGADYALSEQLHVNASVRYIDIQTELSVAEANISGAKIDINPYVYSVMIGYKF